MTHHAPPPRLHRRYPSFNQPVVYRPPLYRRRASTTPGVGSSSSSYSSSATTTPCTSSASASPVLPPYTDGEQRPSGPLVWINGFPGVGKLTIAQWLHRLLGVDRSIILDHHDNLCVPGRTTLPPTPEVEIADPFSMAWCSGPSPSREKGNGEQGSATPLVADLLSRPENATQTILVTSCAVKNEARPSDSLSLDNDDDDDESDDEEGGDEVAAAKAIESTTAMTGRLFIPVYISCREDENMRRVQSAERRYSGSGLGLGFSGRSPKIESAGAARDATRGRKLFAFEDRKGLEVDVTEMEAHEAAMEILEFVHLRVEEWRREVVAGAS